MVNDIVEATGMAKQILAGIRNMPREQITAASLLPLLRQAVSRKLMIPEQAEDNIHNLAIISIKTQDIRAGSLPDEVIRTQIKKYDCHQTSLVTQKKVLLLMFIERELGIYMEDDDALSIETLNDLAELTAGYLKKGD